MIEISNLAAAMETLNRRGEDQPFKREENADHSIHDWDEHARRLVDLMEGY